MIYLDVAEQIEKTRKILHKNIEKYGIDSEKTREVSIQLDELINMYYGKDKEETMQAELKIAWEELKRYTREKEFPSVQEWDKYAKENELMSSESIKFLSRMDWNKLRNKIKAEIN